MVLLIVQFNISYTQDPTQGRRKRDKRRQEKDDMTLGFS
jgi:hypothetical protein